MAETAAAKKQRIERELFGDDTGATSPPPLDDDQTLAGATGIMPTAIETNAAVLAEKRRAAKNAQDERNRVQGEPGDWLHHPEVDEKLLTSRWHAKESPQYSHEFESFGETDPDEPLKRPRQLPANKSFEVLTDNDLLSLAIENVFPKSLEVDEREEGWKSGLAPVEPQYPTEGTVSERLAFLTKRRNQKRENIETAERQNLLTEKYEEADRSASFLSAATDPKRFPELLLDEAVRYAGPKVSEKVQAFKDRVDSLEKTEAQLKETQKQLDELRTLVDNMKQNQSSPTD